MAAKTHRKPSNSPRTPESECVKFITVSYDLDRAVFSGVIVYDILDEAGDPMGETPETLDPLIAEKIAELVLGTE